MQYTNYAMKNNVFGTLSAPISSLATTIQLATGQGQRFTADMLATLESMEGNKVTKREIVKITNVTGDTLTVIRKFAPCPSSDDANTQGQVSYSFSADDTISVYITKEHFDKIDGSINDLYDNGTNKLRTELVSGLQIKVNPGTVLVGSAYYDFAGDTITLTDNATNYVEIDEDGDLVANTSAWGDKNTKIAKVTTSGGAVISIEDRRLGTVGGAIGGVNIHDLTEKDTPSADDELIVSDSESVWQNKKIKISQLGGYSKEIYIENINKGDIVAVKDLRLNSNKTTFAQQKLGETADNQKIAMKFYGDNISSNTLYTFLAKNGNGQDITVRIETDSNGEPSGTLVNANATGTILATDLTTTITETKIQLQDDIVLDKGYIYWVVFSCPSANASNYCKIGIDTDINMTAKIYSNNSWTDLTNEQAAETAAPTLSYGGTETSGNINYGGEFYFYVKCNVRLTSIPKPSSSSYYPVTTKVFEDGTEIFSQASYNGNNMGCDLLLVPGKKYVFSYSNDGGTKNHSKYSEFSINFDFIESSGTDSVMTDGFSGKTFTYKKYMPQATSLAGGFISDFVKKVDTTNIYTYSDIMGVATENGVKGDMKNIAINGGIVENNSWSLTPGQDYYFINNIISKSPVYHTTKIYLGKAISSTALKVDIKIYYYFGPTFDFIVPFSGNLISQNNSQSGGNITIDSSSSIQTIIDIICKGQRLQNSGTYYRALTKNR